MISIWITLYGMATITSTPTALSVTFTRCEKVTGLLRDISVPLDRVSDVTEERDGLAAATGLRAPGLGVPGLRKIGTWRRRVDGRTTRTVVSVRAGRPAVRIRLHGTGWDQILVGTADAHELAARLRRS